MKIRVAINGYGRIGRAYLRALYSSEYAHKIQVVAINELASAASIAHLTKYDSCYGQFAAKISYGNDYLQINDAKIALSHQRRLEDLNWQNIDLVLEASGKYTNIKDLELHLLCGANRVLLSQPGEIDLPTIIFGINEKTLKKGSNQPKRMASAGSCTSNAMVPVLQLLDAELGILAATVTSLHSMMNDQPLLDSHHNPNLYKTRAAINSIVPVETALAAGIVRVLPNLAGKITARALRVPVCAVSAMEFSLYLQNKVDSVKLKQLLRDNCGVFSCSDQPLVSTDFLQSPFSAVVDLTQSQIAGQHVSLLSWFDNEWGYANRLLDLSAYWLS